MNSSLAKNITVLLDTINSNRTEFEKFEGNELSESSEVYFHITSRIKNYNEGITTMGINQKPVVKHDRRIVDSKGYLDRLSESYPSIPKCLNAIKKEGNQNDIESRLILTKLIEHILFKEHKDLNDNRKREIASIFSNDVRKSSATCLIKIWTTSIWLHLKKIRVSDFTTVRKPIDQDYNYLIPSFLLYGDELRKECASIFEIKRTANSDKEIREYLQKLIHVLSLFSPGSVSFVNIEVKLNSIVKPRVQVGYIGGKPGDNLNRLKYKMTKVKARAFQEFHDILIDQLPVDDWINKKKSSNTPVFISVDRYRESLISKQRPEALITYVITSLEALLLGDGEKSELSHRLSQRGAKLLSIFEKKPITIYKKLKEAYTVRSTYIHGSLSSKTKDLTELHRDVVDIARICILIFIEKISNQSKKEILQEIDNAFLDSKSNDKFMKELKSLKIIQHTPYNGKLKTYV